MSPRDPDAMFDPGHLARLPYPIALTLERLEGGLRTRADPLRTLFLLRDSFEASVKFLAAITLADYFSGPAVTAERNSQLLEWLLRPSLGTWVEGVLECVATWTTPRAASSLALWSGLRAPGPDGSTLLGRCKGFVSFRNHALAHGATRSSDAYAADLDAWLPLVGELAALVGALDGCVLYLVVGPDLCQRWSGPRPAVSEHAGRFPGSLIGHFVTADAPDAAGAVSGPARDLSPFICFVPDSAACRRLQFYDSLYRYRATRKDTQVLEYDHGFRHLSSEPIADLEVRFTRELLERTFRRRAGVLEVLEAQIVGSQELIESHANIVGRRGLLARIASAIEGSETGPGRHAGRVVVVEGEPGAGKTALLCHLVDQLSRQPATRPAWYFFRRTSGAVDQDACARVLAHQLAVAGGLVVPASTGGAGAWAVFQEVLAQAARGRPPGAGPVVVLIDALDEAGPGSDGVTSYQRIPDPLPVGVVFVLSTRPGPASAVLVRRGDVMRVRLDDPHLLEETLGDGRAYVLRELGEGRVDERVAAELSRAAAGNFLLLRCLCESIRAGRSPERALAVLAAAGGDERLDAIHGEEWERIVADLRPDDADDLAELAGLIAAARAPLCEDIVRSVTGWGFGRWSVALRRLAPWLNATRLEHDPEHPWYRLYHESFATFLRSRLGADQRRHTNALADYCLGWRHLEPGRGREYALAHAAGHLAAIGRGDDLLALAASPDWMEARLASPALLGDLLVAPLALPPGAPAREELSLLGAALSRRFDFLRRRRGSLRQALFQAVANESNHCEVDPAVRDRLCARLATSLRPGRCLLRLDRTAASPITRVLRHQGAVRSIAAAPDGRRIAVLAGDGYHSARVHVWTTSDWARQEPAPPEAPEGWGGVRWIGFARDALYGLGTDAAVLRLGASGRWEPVPCGLAVAMAVSAHGWIAVADPKNVVRVWDEARGRWLDFSVTYEDEGENLVESLAFSPDGRYLALAASRVEVWEVLTGRRLAGFKTRIRGYHPALEFDPTGRLLIAAGGEDYGNADPKLAVWSVPSGEVVHPTDEFGREPRYPVGSLAIRPDGTDVAVAGDGFESVVLYDVRTGAARPVGDGHGDGVQCVAYSADGSQLYFGTAAGSVHVYAFDRARALRESRPLRGFNRRWGFLELLDGGRLLLSGASNSVELWDAWANAGAPIRPVLVEENRYCGVHAVLADPGSRSFCVIVDRTRDLGSFEIACFDEAGVRRSLEVCEGRPGPTGTAAGGGLVFLGVEGARCVLVINLAAGLVERRIPLPSDAIDLAPLPGGRVVIAHQGGLLIAETDTGLVVDAQGGPTGQLAISPDGGWLASGGALLRGEGNPEVTWLRLRDGRLPGPRSPERVRRRLGPSPDGSCAAVLENANGRGRRLRVVGSGWVTPDDARLWCFVGDHLVVHRGYGGLSVVDQAGVVVAEEELALEAVELAGHVDRERGLLVAATLSSGQVVRFRLADPSQAPAAPDRSTASPHP